MSLRIRFQYPTGSKLGYSIERLSDGSLYDFSTSTFVATPATPISVLPEDIGNFIGRYKLTLTPTPASQFIDGDYVVTVHDQAAANAVVAELAATMHAGDDATVIPQPGSAVVDPWSVSLPGTYASGSAGAILGTNLDAKVSTRSTYAGGPVASVTAPVTVGRGQRQVGLHPGVVGPGFDPGRGRDQRETGPLADPGGLRRRRRRGRHGRDRHQGRQHLDDPDHGRPPTTPAIAPR